MEQQLQIVMHQSFALTIVELINPIDQITDVDKKPDTAIIAEMGIFESGLEHVYNYLLLIPPTSVGLNAPSQHKIALLAFW